MGEEEKRAVLGVLDDNWLTEGPHSREFVERLNALTGAPYGVLAPNGTLALALGLMAIGVGEGDEVIVPNCTFIGSATSILLAGARPVFVDVEPEAFQIDTGHIEAAITSRTKAIMPVHLLGTAADMDAINAIAAHQGLKVIEDAAQGIGVTFAGRHVGALGDVGCFSFFADKTLTTGEGGYVCCHDESLYERLRLLRNQGRSTSGSYVHPAIGFNFRLTDLQAAIGLAQLDRLEEIKSRKTALIGAYRNGLEGLTQVRIVGAARKSNHVPFRCALMCDDAASLAESLEKNGIETRGFFYPLHKQPCFAGFAGTSSDDAFPNSIRAYERGLCLPIYPAMTAADVHRIVSVVQDHYG